jgi:hypothetical protein
MMKWEGLEGSSHGLILRYYPGICLEGLSKSMKNLCQDSWSPGLDLNPGPPEYEAGVLTIRPWFFVDHADGVTLISEMWPPMGLLFIPPMIYKHGEPCWNDTDSRAQRKTCKCATLSTINPTWTAPGMNLGHHSEKLAINHISFIATYTTYWCRKFKPSETHWTLTNHETENYRVVMYCTNCNLTWPNLIPCFYEALSFKYYN